MSFNLQPSFAARLVGVGLLRSLIQDAALVPPHCACLEVHESCAASSLRYGWILKKLLAPHFEAFGKGSCLISETI